MTDANARVPSVGDVYGSLVNPWRYRYTVTRIISGARSKYFVRPTAFLTVTELDHLERPTGRRVPTVHADFRALAQSFKLLEVAH